jgi:NAD+ kinase
VSKVSNVSNVSNITGPPVSRVSRVGIVAKSHLHAAAPHLVEIASWLEARAIEPVFETATAMLAAETGGGGAARRVFDKAALVAEVDLIVVLGGDGTLLSMADCIGATGVDAAGAPDVPILGVNFGRLGFLTEVRLPELYPSLDAVVSGTARIEERLMLRSTTMRNGAPRGQHVTLNDVVVTKAARSRMLELSVSVGEEFVARVKADGLIVATPTGSTAYNLAAGGPIVQPEMDAIVLTPIAPHMLTNRPIVIPSGSPVRVQPVMDQRDEVYVTFDGQEGYQLERGDEVIICCATRRLKLLRPSSRSYFEVLREKLKWNEG